LSCGVIASEEGNDVPGFFLMGTPTGKIMGQSGSAIWYVLEKNIKVSVLCVFSSTNQDRL
jgi:hypothetical protein